MKIEIEIKEDKFLYSYEVGTSKGEGEMELSEDRLSLFSEVVRLCNRQFAYKTEQEINEIRCFAYLEKHPELIKKYNKFRGK